MPKLWRAARGILASIGLAMVLITLTPATYWYATYLAGSWEDPRGDVLIVLGASALAPGMMAADTYHRVSYAVLFWRQGGFAKIVVCGKDLAGPMRDMLVASGVPAGSILLEDGSRSTRENALAAAVLLSSETGRKVLVTSDFHMFRAHRAFRRAGLDVLPRPIPDVRQRWFTVQQRLPAFLDLLEETAKIIYYWTRSWI